MEDKRNKWAEIVSKLKQRNLTIATMESCTGGGIANEITSISDASSVLGESYVTYCNAAKIKQGVSSDIIAKYTVYSLETAIEMAKAVERQAKSDISIGVTGQLGRIDPNNPVDKLNHVWIAVRRKSNKLVVRELHVPEDERKIQKKIVIEAVADILLNLL